jgi:hypothetical protein
MDIFLKTFKIKSILSVHAEMGCLVNKEKKYIVSTSLKTLLIVLNIDSNAASYFLLSHRSILSITGRLSEQFSGPQAAPLKTTFRVKGGYCESRNSFLKRVTIIIFTVNKEARRTLILDGRQ